MDIIIIIIMDIIKVDKAFIMDILKGHFLIEYQIIIMDNQVAMDIMGIMDIKDYLDKGDINILITIMAIMVRYVIRTISMFIISSITI